MLIDRILLFSFLVWNAVVPGNEMRTMRLFAAGDTMLARWTHQEDYGGTAEKMYGGVLPRMKDADLAFVNLECVLSDRGAVVDKGEIRPYPYRARPRMVRFLADAGVDLASQANNHVGDYGPLALQDSLEILRTCGIMPLGAGENLREAAEPRYVKTRDTVIAWIAFDTQEPAFKAGPDLPGTLYLSQKQILSTLSPVIRKAKKKAHLVIVTGHWTPNWSTSPTPELQSIARALIDAGADAILGHSSHVLQGMEVYRDRPILYDMGSFLFDSISDKRLRESMYFELEYSRWGIHRVRGFPTRLNWRSVDLAPPDLKAEITRAFVSNSTALNPDFSYRQRTHTDHIEVSCVPRPQPRGHVMGEAFRVITKSLWTPPIPEKGNFDFERKPPCVLKGLPPEIGAFKPVTLESGIEYLGGSLPARVPQNFSFFTRLYFRAAANVPGSSREVYISLRAAESQAASAPAVYHHEPGDWAWPTTDWESGDIIEDINLFRPPLLPVGNYDVFLSMRTIPKDTEPEIRIGTITITKPQKSDKVEGLAAYRRPSGAGR